MTVIQSIYEPRPHSLAFHARSERFAIMVFHRRAGKALDVDTPIPMYAGGFRKMGDLRAGDVVFGADGSPVTVTAAHPVQLGRPCYEVLFDDGQAIVADEDHLWATTRKNDRHNWVSVLGVRWNSPRPASVRTTLEIRDTLVARGENNHRVALCGAVQYAPADLPLDPYVLGTWLGDGTARSAQITSMDAEVVSAWQAEADRLGQKLVQVCHNSNTGLARTYAITGGRGGSRRRGAFSQHLHTLDLHNNKHIPAQYLYASVAQRWALLQGLMDSDGSVRRGRNTCENTQKHKVLADELGVLLSGLGIKWSMLPKKVNGQTYYRVAFSCKAPPFRIARKRANFLTPPGVAFSGARSIVAVTPVPSRPVRCITVDSHDSLYLCGEGFIPTHNTVMCINDLIDKAVQNPRPMPRYGYIAPFYKQAKDVAWSYLKMYAAPLIEKVMESELSVQLINGAIIRLYGADNPDALRGVYFDGVVLDEYGDMQPRLFGEVIAPTLADRKGWAAFIGTPKGPNHFFELWEDAKKTGGWFWRMLKASESGIIDAAELNMLAKLPGSDEDTFRQEFECDFQAAIRGSYYGKLLNQLESTHMGSFPWDPDLAVYTAWDIGYSDDTSIWFYQTNGAEIKVIDFFTVAGFSVADVLAELRTRPYGYGEAWLPHDAKNKSFQTGKSTRELLHEDGLKTRIVPSLSVQDGIQAVRKTLPKVYFNTAKEDVRIGVNALRVYQRKWDDKRRMFSEQPLHDWASNPADAFRMLALATNPAALRKGSENLARRKVVPISAAPRAMNLDNLFADRERRNNEPRRI